MADGCCLGFLYPGNAQGPTATLSFSPLRHVTAYVNFVTGNTISNRQGFTEYEVGVIYKFATSSTMTFLYRDLRMSGVDQANVLRAQLDYSF